MNIENISLVNGTGNFAFPTWLHTIDYVIAECIGRAAVPFFFLCSSMLLYSKEFTFSSNLRKKIRTLFVPYFLCISLHILLFVIAQSLPFMAPYFQNENNRIAEWSWIQWLDAYVGKIQSDAPFCVHLWFIRDLLILNVFAVILKKIVWRFPKLSSLFCILLWIMNYQTKFLDKQAIVFWIFGMLAVKYKTHFSNIDKIPVLLLSAGWVLSIGADVIFNIYWFHQLVKVISLVCILAFSKIILDKGVSLIKGKIFNVLSQNTLFIYMFHVIIISTMCKIAVRFIAQKPMVQLTEYFAFPIMAVAICACAACICKKILPPLYKLLVGGRV